MRPVFELYFDNAHDIKVSLVQVPAIDKLFLAFDKQKEFKFSIEDEEKRIIVGPVLRPDYLIFRRDEKIGEYYVKFSRETIAQIQKEFLKNSHFNLNHSVDTQGLVLLESFLVDPENGISPKGFEEIEPGSWFIKLYCSDDAIWDKVKHGDFAGFSIESIFSFEEVKLAKQNDHKMTIKALKIKLAKLLLKLGTATAVKDEVEYAWEFEGPELIDGTEVFITDENEELVHPEDGEYAIGEDIWEVRDGIVRKVVKEVEETKEEVVEAAEEEVKEETKEEIIKEETPEDNIREEIDAINKRLDEISAVIDDFMELTTKISSRLEELETKLAKVSLQAPEKLEKEEVIKDKDENPYACLRK